MRGRLRPALGALLAAVCCAAAPASAHPLAPSLLEIEAEGEGRFAVHFKTPRQRPSGVEVAPELPAHCVSTGAPRSAADAASWTLRWNVDCGERGLVGARVAVRGLAGSATNALVRIGLGDGRRVSAVLHAGEPGLFVPARAAPLAVARDYGRLGAAHIAGGYDHLLFVFGLLLLVADARSLVATITAFTAGHSLTLSLAALGWVRFPTGPIELVIAATILTLALELARGPSAHPSALRRRPWAVALGFGLLHGLGFAGALAEVGLPQEEIPLALLTFNLGIELGQLVFVGVVLAARALLAPALRAAPPWLAGVPVTAMGALAVYWCLDRTASLFGIQ